MGHSRTWTRVLTCPDKAPVIACFQRQTPGILTASAYAIYPDISVWSNLLTNLYKEDWAGKSETTAQRHKRGNSGREKERVTDRRTEAYTAWLRDARSLEHSIRSRFLERRRILRPRRLTCVVYNGCCADIYSIPWRSLLRIVLVLFASGVAMKRVRDSGKLSRYWTMFKGAKDRRQLVVCVR